MSSALYNPLSIQQVAIEYLRTREKKEDKRFLLFTRCQYH